MLTKLFENQKNYLNYFFSALSMEEVTRVFETLKSCKGSLVLTGVGKSGYIAQKIATTLVSTGTRAFFLSPADALHGDIGRISREDVLLAFSKSGESEEILNMMPHVEKKGAFRIAVVSHKGSRLEETSDLTVHLPLQRELCPYDLAPTTSTAIQLIFGDCLAIALMQEKEFSLSEFAANHPAGLLGKKSTLRVSDLMLKGENLPLCKEEDLLLNSLHELSTKRCGCLLIINSQKELKGIFTDGDLRRSIEKSGADVLKMPLKELMTKLPRSISPHLFAYEALKEMEENPSKLITVLPVLEGKGLIGLIRMHDILQAGLR